MSDVPPLDLHVIWPSGDTDIAPFCVEHIRPCKRAFAAFNWAANNSEVLTPEFVQQVLDKELVRPSQS